jgi:hypothetical protein
MLAACQNPVDYPEDKTQVFLTPLLTNKCKKYSVRRVLMAVLNT